MMLRSTQWLVSLARSLGMALVLMALVQLPILFFAMVREDQVATVSFAYSTLISALFALLILVATNGAPKKTSRRLNVLGPLVFYLIVPIFAGVPFFISIEFSSFFSAYFEAVSALTTTGASVLDQWYPLSDSLILWRALLGWFGGLVCLTFTIAVFSQLNVGGMHLYHSNLKRGMGDNFMDKMRLTMQQLVPIYSGLTIICYIFLILAGAEPYQSFILAMSAISTTGFHAGFWQESALNQGLPEFVLAVFMLVGAMNILFFWWMTNRHMSRSSRRQQEVSAFLGLTLMTTIVSAVYFYTEYQGDWSWFEALNSAFFVVSSAISTTGFVPYNFDVPVLFVGVLVAVLVMVGGTLGSTAGGFKVMRVMVLIQHARLELRKLAHPHGVGQLHYEGATVEPDEVKAIWLWLFSGLLLVVVSTLIISAFEHSFSASLSSVIAAFSSAGPAVQYIDPSFDGYYQFGVVEQIVLIILMVFGRVEGALALAIFYKIFWDR